MPVMKKDERAAILKGMQAVFPAVFDPAKPKPLAIGIRERLHELCPMMNAKTIGKVLKWWCGNPVYLQKIAAGGPRFNLDGTESGEIAPHEQEDAAKRLAAIKLNQDNRKAWIEHQAGLTAGQKFG